ncbi:hypothetical protein ANN_06887 [Periplaneta americana]|uniref:Uncharacterized protein n=1 Tax=Periplaneta americana TaxID=6978 RepID=A0ABQ8TFM6_PERAM|nr:hypothetical protein ANN_06887 [Periplaneta americana]
MWVFVANITEDVILGLDPMRIFDATVDVRRRILRFGQDEVFLRDVEDQPMASRLTLEDHVTIPAGCEMVVTTRLDGQPKRNLLLDSQTTPIDGVYVARSLLPNQKVVPVRVLNVTNWDKEVPSGTVLGNVEPVVSVTSLAENEECHRPRPDLDPSLKELARELPANLSKKERRKVHDLLTEFQDVFSLSENDYGRTEKVQHRIDTGSARPIRQPPRRVPLAKQKEIDSQLEGMKARGVIEESDRPWSSPVVLVKKKNGDLRFCVDYRKLNDVTKKHVWITRNGRIASQCGTREKDDGTWDDKKPDGRTTSEPEREVNGREWHETENSHYVRGYTRLSRVIIPDARTCKLVSKSETEVTGGQEDRKEARRTGNMCPGVELTDEGMYGLCLRVVSKMTPSQGPKEMI